MDNCDMHNLEITLVYEQSQYTQQDRYMYII